MLLNKINFMNYQNPYTPKRVVNSKLAKNPTSTLTSDTVNFSSKNKVKLGFASKFLYKAQIRQLDKNGEEKLIPAKITRLDPYNSEDKAAMKSINKSWNKTEWAGDITKNFETNLEKNKFLALEITDKDKKLEDRILCLAETNSKAGARYNFSTVEHLQSAPTAEHGKDRKYKGAGEVLMYGICKYAKHSGESEVTLKSTNNDFYDYIKMPKDDRKGKDWYTFRKDSMNIFMRRAEAKYGIKPD